MAPFQHFVMTRFSVKPAWAWEEFPREWLDTRIDLFEEFCLPSLAAQSAQDFRWLVYCDESTDAECLARLRSLSDICPQLEIVLTGKSRHLVRLIDPMVSASTEVVVTTRLDSDDGIHIDLLGAVQEYVDAYARSSHEEFLLNFPRGLKYDASARIAYASHLDNSPFHSLFERPVPGGHTRSVMSGNHSRLHEQYPTHQDHSLIGWLQVIYGGNMRNHITGRDIRMDPACLPELFGVHPGESRDYWTELPPAPSTAHQGTG